MVLTFAPDRGVQSTGGRGPGCFPSLLGRLRGARGAVLFLVLAGLGLVLPGLVVPVFSQVFVDEILVGGQERLAAGAADRHGRHRGAARAVLTWLQLRYLVRLHDEAGVGMSSSFLWHVLAAAGRLLLRALARRLAGRVQLNDEVASLLSGRLAGVVLDLMLVVFYLALMAPSTTCRMRWSAVVTALIYVTLLVIAAARRGSTTACASRSSAGKLDGDRRRRPGDDRDDQGHRRRDGVLRALGRAPGQAGSMRSRRSARRDR